MTESISKDDAGVIIISALRLARERVTGGSPEGKRQRRARLEDAIDRMTGALTRLPPASELAELLGDPDDAVLRGAISAWGKAHPEH